MKGGKSTMNDDRRKLLTNYLGECWHIYNGIAWVCQQAGCNAHTPRDKNRTFTDPMDMDALRRRLVEKRDWDNFLDFCENTFAKADHPCICDFCQEYIGWLMDPERFSMLVAEWLEEKNNG
jgi:hypothetical protein